MEDCDRQLLEAVKEHNFGKVKFLLHAGANVHILDEAINDGDLIHVCCANPESGGNAIIELLLEADIVIPKDCKDCDIIKIAQISKDLKEKTI